SETQKPGGLAFGTPRRLSRPGQEVAEYQGGKPVRPDYMAQGNWRTRRHADAAGDLEPGRGQVRCPDCAVYHRSGHVCSDRHRLWFGRAQETLCPESAAWRGNLVPAFL